MLEITDRNPAAVLRGHFEQAKTDHRPALPREELTEFFCRLILAEIEPQNRIALILNMLTFLRSTELRGGQWNEIDFDAAMWTVPAQRMKHEKTAPKPPHAVPLADWTLELLAELKEITGRDLCKKALPPTAEIQTQVFGCFCFKYPLILLKHPLNPP